MTKKNVVEFEVDRFGCWKPQVQSGRRVARRMYEAFYGEIAPGLCVLHHCDDHRCVNPFHLFLGSQEENMMDMMKKGRGQNGGDYTESRFPGPILPPGTKVSFTIPKRTLPQPIKVEGPEGTCQVYDLKNGCIVMRADGSIPWLAIDRSYFENPGPEKIAVRKTWFRYTRDAVAFVKGDSSSMIEEYKRCGYKLVWAHSRQEAKIRAWELYR